MDKPLPRRDDRVVYSRKTAGKQEERKPVQRLEFPLLIFWFWRTSTYNKMLPAILRTTSQAQTAASASLFTRSG